MKRIPVSITTDGSGNGTGLGSSCYGTLYAMQLIDGTFDDGVDVTLTCEVEDMSIPLYVEVDFNTDKIKYPRVLQHLATDGTNLTTHCEPLVYGKPKVTIAQGGATKTGQVILYVRDYI